MTTKDIFRPWRDSPLLSSSMEDFESNAQFHSVAQTPATVRPNPFNSPGASSYSDVTDDELQKSWPSPSPAWRKAGSGWFRNAQGAVSPVRSRHGSPDADHVEVDEEVEADAAAEIPLPGSPVKGRSVSRSLSPERNSASPGVQGDKPPDEPARRSETPARTERSKDNYIRFTVRADVQHHTAPLENAVLGIRNFFSFFVNSPTMAVLSIIGALIAFTFGRALFVSPALVPSPDLIKVAGMARSFEPLMYYSETGHTQAVKLGETQVAVWDLTESVRWSNMTSGPIIVKELEELCSSLQLLAEELTHFFANIDGDIDNILITMEWAQRELAKISSIPETKTSTVFSNVHTALSKVGILEYPFTGGQTAVGKLVQDLFGQTLTQLTRATMQRTFMDFLGVLEESINNELTASISLFAHLEAIDRQFLNLQRTVLRETDAQEREESEVLASLWTRIIGGNAARLRKFEKNKQLLSSLRDRTVQNKHVLVDHNSRLRQLRSNLEILRKKLVSPLVRSNVSSTLSVDEQLKGLEGTYTSLRATREDQKIRLYQLIHAGAVGSPRTVIAQSQDGHRIEAR